MNPVMSCLEQKKDFGEEISSNKHSEDICVDIAYSEEKCEKIHQYECKFAIRCRFRNNNECMYFHATHASDYGKFQAVSQVSVSCWPSSFKKVIIAQLCNS